ncbi:MAG: helix-hairpin-helix domain-containing protein [Deltaproteobacteria bacterium]|nr:helix-hairpin-helix domain-containing protein [Deltaproteobacteria bacterium]
MNRFSFFVFLFIAVIVGIIGKVTLANEVLYYSDDIICDYKIPVSIGICKTLFCKGRYVDAKSLNVLKRCGCAIRDISVSYGKKVIINEDCSVYEYDMSGYERLLLGMRLDMNTANLKDLISIDGIGEELASRIIEYRIKNGKFKRVDELLKVKGIGINSLGRLEKNVCIECGQK